MRSLNENMDLSTLSGKPLLPRQNFRLVALLPMSVVLFISITLSL